jgi:hypothetical protein
MLALRMTLARIDWGSMSRLGYPNENSLMGSLRSQHLKPIIIQRVCDARLAKRLVVIDFANTFLVADRTQR